MSLIHVIAIPQSAGVAYSPIARLNVCADRAGIATITVVPSGAIDFPASCVLNAPTYETEIAGAIVQAGIHTVAVTMNGVSDTVEVEVIALPNNVMIGPETSLDYEGLPVTFNLVASCDRPNTLITLSSVGTGITLPDPPQVLVDGPPVEFPVTVSTYGEFEVIGAYGLDSSTCYIHSINTDDTTGCYVTGTIKDLGGQPVRDAEVVFKPVPVTQTLTSGILSRSAKIAHTARDGTFSIRLLRGSTVIAVCDTISLRKTFTVPNQATVDIEDV